MGFGFRGSIYEYPGPCISHPLPFYTNKERQFGPLKFDRVFRDGETFDWQGFTLNVDWMPGQNEIPRLYARPNRWSPCAFTGDNIFASTVDPQQNGHEAVLSRNDCILEEGYIYAAEYLHTINPDLIIGGHCWVY